MRLHEVKIAGTGSWLPGEAVAFEDIEQILGEFEGQDEDFYRWYKRSRKIMRQLLGMENYFYALDPLTRTPTQTCASMAAHAARPALAQAGISAEEVDLLIYAGSSMDHFICPPTSVLVQQALGIPSCAEYSIHSNCTATYKAIELAFELLGTGRYQTALIVSSSLVSNALKSSYYNPAHLTRDQAMLRWFLCDGAGALVLRRGDVAPGPGLYVVDTFLESVGSGVPPHMYSRAGASTAGPLPDYSEGLHHITQDFRAVSTLGPRLFVEGFRRMVAQIRKKKGDDHFRTRARDVSHFLVNVPSRHLIDLAGEDLAGEFKPHLGDQVPFDLYYSTIDKRGYTGPASILLTLDRLFRTEPLRPGQLIVSFVTESSKWMNAGFMLEGGEPTMSHPFRA